VHSRCTLAHSVQRCFQFSHRCKNRWIERLDITLSCDMRLCMTQNALDDFLVCAQLIQIRRDTTPESVPAIPFQLHRLNGGMNDALNQLVQVTRLAAAGVEHQTGCGISRGKALRIQGFRRLANDRDRLGARSRLWPVDNGFPYRPVDR